MYVLYCMPYLYALYVCLVCMPCMYACQVGSTVILQMKKPVGQETAEFKMKRADFRQVEKIKVV